MNCWRQTKVLMAVPICHYAFPCLFILLLHVLGKFCYFCVFQVQWMLKSKIIVF